MLKKKFDISVISSYRLELLGFTALWIVLHHCYNLDLSLVPDTSVLGKILCTAVSVIKPAGNVGVEIFLICSGLGLYYSFSKNSNLKSFYKKRAIRILPPLLIVSSIFYSFMNVGAREYFSSVFLIDYFTKGKTDFWYFALLIVLYIIYPLIHKFVEKQKDIVVIGFIAFLTVISFVIVYILKLDLGTRYYAILRIPSFIIGVWLGKKSLAGQQISTIWIFICAVTATVCFAVVSAMHLGRVPMNFINSSYIYYFINIPFSVSLSLLITTIFSRVNLRFIKAASAFFGTISLELYLIFERATAALENIVNIHDATYITFYIAAFVLTVVLSVLLQNISGSITSVFTKNYKKLNK